MKIIGKACLYLAIMTVLFGFVYAFLVTGIAQLVFPHQANGSIIEVNGKLYGSELLGQQFQDAGHLWGRMMNIDTGTFTDKQGNPVMYAWATNKSPASDEYGEIIAQRVETIRAAHPDKEGVPIPVDLVTVSGGGMDPEISPAAAEYQVSRIAANTGYDEQQVRKIINKYTSGRFLGLFGEPRVNVLKVNLTLEGLLL